MTDPQTPANPQNRSIPPLPDPSARPAPEPGPLTKPAPVIRPPKRRGRWLPVLVAAVVVTAGAVLAIAAISGAFG